MPMSTTKENIKSRNSSMLLIDSKKFEELVIPVMIDHSLTWEKLSKRFGYKGAYFSNLRRNGVISRQAMILLDKEFGIKYDDYKLVETDVKETPKENSEPQVSLNIDEIVKVLKQCLFDLDFMANEMKEMKKTIDDLKAQSELNAEVLNDIKNHTARIKPSATLSRTDN